MPMSISGSLNEMAVARRHSPHGLTPPSEFWPPVIFSSTYNCVEQDGSQGSWLICDGLLELLSQSTTNGNWEQVTTAANYSGGGGGRGQRQWVGQSHGGPDHSGGIRWRAQDWGGLRQEYWLRWYVRYEAGLKLGGDSAPIARNQKVLYWAGANAGQPNGMYFDLQGGRCAIVVGGTAFNGTTNMGWDWMYGGAPNSDVASDGRWIRMELHVKNATGGGLNDDGVAEWWVDGTPTLSRADVDMKGSIGFADFEFPSNGQFSTVLGDAADQAIDLDDLAVSIVGQIGPYSAARGY